jgi:hypothetical protein
MMKNEIVFAIIVIAAAITTTTTITPLNAQILEKDNIPDIPLSGNVTTLGEIDLSVDFSEGLLPPNGTQTLSTAGITDIDITSLPGPGFTLILDNQSATVTLHPVQIVPDASADDAPVAAGGGGGDSSSDSDNDDEDEEG